MKKILLVLTLAIAMVSCKEQPQTQIVEPTLTDWVVEIHFLDKSTDTITVRSYNKPFIYIEGHVSTVTMGDSYRPIASYVKSIKILN